MEYQVLILPRAQRKIESLPLRTRKRIGNAIDALAENPRQQGIKKLKGAEDLYRLRVGDYRIIYSIEDGDLIVIVVNTGHRKNIYRDLS